MNSIIVGIDVSKETFDAAVLINNKVQTRNLIIILKGLTN
ncbi:putative transposase [Orientia tsutsugamushi str. UT144]|uniref:Putative transposase n=1 Tax=Orientia tsutsugamushi str. UT144 TaxID=1441384 RepID=A0A0F3RIF5_ORITS|nr:putative transposase [Orientia tsutsugamushi str. UT144]